MPVPSDGSVHRQLIRAREAATGRNGAPEILVAWKSLQLPVATVHGTLPAPQLLLAIRMPECLIASHRLVVDGDPNDAAMELAGEALAARHGRNVVVDRRFDIDSGEFGSASRPAITVSATRSLLSPWFGNRVGGLRILHRKMREPSEDLARPITVAEAQAKVARAIAQHNRGKAHR